MTASPTPSIARSPRFLYGPGDRPLEGYTIRRAIHRGGFGEVYYAMSDSGKEVALKLVQNEHEVELRGVRQCLNIKHPNLVTLFDIRVDGQGEHWIVMEYVAGTQLSDVLGAFPNGLPLEEVRDWLSGIVAGVTHLHERGIVHRDLKPANIYRENGTVKVGDVGLSKRLSGDRRGQHTEAIGTIYYMAPEVAHGRYGLEVDVYSLAVVLYEMLCGRLPFDGESTGEIILKQMTAAPDLTPLPPALRSVLARGLVKDPAVRTPSVRQLEEEFLRATGLAAATAPEVTSTATPTPADSPAPEAGRPAVPVSVSAFNHSAAQRVPVTVRPVLPETDHPGARADTAVRPPPLPGTLPPPLPPNSSSDPWGRPVPAGSAARRGGCDPAGSNTPQQLYQLPPRPKFKESNDCCAWSGTDWQPKDFGLMVAIGVGLLFVFPYALPVYVAVIAASFGLRSLLDGPAIARVAAATPATPQVPPNVSTPAQPSSASPSSAAAGRLVAQVDPVCGLGLSWAAAALLSIVAVAVSYGLLRSSHASGLPAGPEGFMLLWVSTILASWACVTWPFIAPWLPGGDDSTPASSNWAPPTRLQGLGVAFVLGVAVWQLQEFLHVSIPDAYVHRPLFHSLFGYELSDGRGLPTPFGYIWFMIGLFAVRGWTSIVAPSRPVRAGLWMVLQSLAVAALWSCLFEFPFAFAMALAGSMTWTSAMAAAWIPGPRRGVRDARVTQAA